MENLRSEILKFRTWQKDFYSGKPEYELNGEWECAYNGWDKIYTAFSHVLSAYLPQEAEHKLLSEMVYIIARDNESEWLIEETVPYDGWFALLCRCSLKANEPDARWQFASRLAECGCNQEIKKLILRFVEDKNEYVSRRALLVLPNILPKQVEHYVLLFWDRDCFGTVLLEYQRMALLDALSTSSSPLLDTYLEKARQSGQPYLMHLAEKIKCQ